MKRTPPRTKRPTPRRNEGRVTHARTKPKAGAPPTAQEARHIAQVRAMPCLVCGRAATVHHVTGYADRAGRIPRSHKRIVPLAPEYHMIQPGPRTSVEALGHQGFFITYRIDLLAETDRLWDAYCAGR